MVALADRFHNDGIVFIHFSARHRTEVRKRSFRAQKCIMFCVCDVICTALQEIQTAMNNLPKGLVERSFALLDGL